MRILTRLLARFGPAGRLADVAVVGGAALKVAQRKGWISEETAKNFGASDSSAGSRVSVGEMLVLGMAVWRLVRQFSKQDDAVVIDVIDG